MARMSLSNDRGVQTGKRELHESGRIRQATLRPCAKALRSKIVRAGFKIALGQAAPSSVPRPQPLQECLLPTPRWWLCSPGRSIAFVPKHDTGRSASLTATAAKKQDSHDGIIVVWVDELQRRVEMTQMPWLVASPTRVRQEPSWPPCCFRQRPF